MPSRTHFALLTSAALVLLACDNRSSGLDSVIRPATLSFYGNAENITLPDTAVAGVPTAVRVRSYGGGCVAQDRTVSAVSGRSATIRPFVRELAPGANVACADILLQFSHEVDLVFEQPGQATVRVDGWREPERTPYTITRSVQVVLP